MDYIQAMIESDTVLRIRRMGLLIPGTRVIDLFVDILPLQDLGFKHASLQKEGRPPYEPSLLFKLYLYGYKHSIRSSRKLEHSCKVNLELYQTII